MPKRKASESDDEYFPNEAELRRTKRARNILNTAPAATAAGSKKGKKGGKRSANPTSTTARPQSAAQGNRKRRAADNDDDFVQQEDSLRRSKRIRGVPPSPVPSSAQRPRRLLLRAPRPPIRPILRVDTRIAEYYRTGVDATPPSFTPISQMSVPMSISEGPDPATSHSPPPASPAIEREPSVESGVSSHANYPLTRHRYQKVSDWVPDAAATKHHKVLERVFLPESEESRKLIGHHRFFSLKQWNQVLKNRNCRSEGQVTDQWSSEESQSLDTDSRENRQAELHTIGEIEAARQHGEALKRRFRQYSEDLGDREMALLPHGFDPHSFEPDGERGLSMEEREWQIIDFELPLREQELRRDHGYLPPPANAPLYREDRQALFAAFERSMGIPHRDGPALEQVAVIKEEEDEEEEEGREELGTMQRWLRHMLRGGDDPAPAPAQDQEQNQNQTQQDRIPWQRRRALLYGYGLQDLITPAERRIIAEHPHEFTRSERDIAIESREEFLAQGGDEAELTDAEMALSAEVVDPDDDEGSVQWVNNID